MTQVYTTAPLELTPEMSSSTSFFRSVDVAPRSQTYNPFSRIYDPNTKVTGTRLGGYERIPNDPIVTIIEDLQGLRRNGSVISQEMVLRNRKRIRKRNKLREKPNYSSRFRFPVKRTSSLKQKSMFNNKELISFTESRNYRGLLLSLLPRQMKVFRHSKVLKVYPELTYELVEFNQGRNKVQPHKWDQVRPNLIDIVYSRYKQQVYDLKCTIPPKFQELFPNDLNILPKQDLRIINKRLLLEVLFRKTIAAKLEYRLHQPERGTFTSTSTSASASTTTSSSSFSGPSHHSQAASFTYGFSSDSSQRNSQHSYSTLPSPNLNKHTRSGKHKTTTYSYPTIQSLQDKQYKLQPRERSNSILTDSSNQQITRINTSSTSWSGILGSEDKNLELLQIVNYIAQTNR